MRNSTPQPAVLESGNEPVEAPDASTEGERSHPSCCSGKLVLTLATTGNVNSRENNPNLPCSPKEMADDMHECIKLGVSVLHIHARNEELKPTMRLDKFRETCRLVKEEDPDVIIQISTGGAYRIEYIFRRCSPARLSSAYPWARVSSPRWGLSIQISTDCDGIVMKERDPDVIIQISTGGV